MTAAELARWLLDKAPGLASDICRAEGCHAVHSGRPWLMVCGHQAGQTLFGAERSLLDILLAFQALGLNVLVVLPEANNRSYVSEVLDVCQHLAILPMAWWQQGAQISPVTCEQLEGLMREFGVAHLYLNTVVHYEPVLAARAYGIPVSVHARELPFCDPALCETLNAEAEEVRAHALESADILVANSRYLADFYRAPVAQIVPNAVEAGVSPAGSPATAPFRVGMISSNLPKKGLDDFVSMARALANRNLPVSCVLVGPENVHIAKLKAAADRRELPDNLEFAGYVADPV